jgi:hypothetical protein
MDIDSQVMEPVMHSAVDTAVDAVGFPDHLKDMTDMDI